MAKTKKTQTPDPVVTNPVASTLPAEETKGDALFGGEPEATPEVKAEKTVVKKAKAPVAINSPDPDPDPVPLKMETEVLEEESGSVNSDDLFAEVETTPAVEGIEDLIGDSGKGSVVVSDPHEKPESKKKNGMVTRANMYEEKMSEAETQAHQENLDATLSNKIEASKRVSKKVPLSSKPRILNGICEFCGTIKAGTEGAVIVRHSLKVELRKEEVPILHDPNCYWAKFQMKLQG